MATKKLQILGSLGSNVDLDTTLTIEGNAADAKATGDAINNLNNLVGDVLEQLDRASYKEHTVLLSIEGFTRSSNGTFASTPSDETTNGNGRRTNYISTNGVTKIFGNVGFYVSCATVAFYDANKAYLSDISVIGSEFLASEVNYGEGTFELDITDEKYSNASYFVVSSYRSQNEAHKYYYSQAIDFSDDYCKYTTHAEEADAPRYRIGQNTIAFFGDSITEGGYPELIASITGASVTNYGVGGATLASGTTASTYIVDKVNAYTGNDDIICVSGGFNDYYKEVPLGTLTAGYNDALDTTTIAGSLETIFRKLLTDHTAAKLYFVITHKAAGAETNPNEDGLTFEDYHDTIIRVLEKYSIPFYDAFSDSGLITNFNAPWGAEASRLYTKPNEEYPDGDATHPNEDGYIKYYVYPIISMMENGIGSGDTSITTKKIQSALSYTPADQADVEALSADKVSIGSLSLGLHSDGKYYIFVDGVPVGTGFELSGGSGGTDNPDSTDEEVVTHEFITGFVRSNGTINTTSTNYTYTGVVEYIGGDIDFRAITANGSVTWSIIAFYNENFDQNNPSASFLGNIETALGGDTNFFNTYTTNEYKNTIGSNTDADIVEGTITAEQIAEWYPDTAYIAITCPIKASNTITNISSTIENYCLAIQRK